MRDIKTPDEWCALRGLTIIDADGWRESDGRRWDDPITESEFRRRFRRCTVDMRTAEPYLDGGSA